MNDQEIRDLSEILELYEDLSAREKHSQDEQDNLDMAEYILIQSIKSLLEEVKSLKREGNKPMDDLAKTAIELAASLRYVIRTLPEECKEAYKAFNEAYTKEIGKKIPAVAVNIEVPLLDEFKKALPELRVELEKLTDQFNELFGRFNERFGEIVRLKAELNLSVEEART